MDVTVDWQNVRLGRDNGRELVRVYDFVGVMGDNFATRYLLADACVLERRTLVSAAVLRFEGQLSTFRPHDGGPCYRCLYPSAPPAGMVPSCAQAGVFGAVTGVMGTLQATEVLKEILGIGEGLSGRLLVWDALAMRFHTIRLSRDPDCRLCGEHAPIHYLSGHATSAPSAAVHGAASGQDATAPSCVQHSTGQTRRASCREVM